VREAGYLESLEIFKQFNIFQCARSSIPTAVGPEDIREDQNGNNL